MRKRRFELEQADARQSKQFQRMLDSAKEKRVAPTPPPAGPQEVSPSEALERLTVAVQSNRVVIVAEEHQSPEHRAFGAAMLPALHAAGITHLALEASRQQPLDEAMRTGVVTPGTEAFAFEPQRAGLLRAAIALRLPIVAFDVAEEDEHWMLEHPDQSMAHREEVMARNIRQRIVEPCAESKVLVWVGMGHAQKRVGLVKMMADWLCEEMEQEPYSAYQVTGLGLRPGVDLVIRHPDATSFREHPSWLRTSKHLSVSGVVRPTEEYLVQLVPATERGGTPADQLLTQGDGEFKLLVLPGNYDLRVWNESAGLVHERPLAVTTDVQRLRVSGQ